MNSTCINSVIVINHVEYQQIESNTIKILLNTNTNNSLTLCSFVPFNKELLDREKFKLNFLVIFWINLILICYNSAISWIFYQNLKKIIQFFSTLF